MEQQTEPTIGQVELSTYDQYNKAWQQRSEQQRIKKQQHQLELAQRWTMEQNADVFFSAMPPETQQYFIDRYKAKHPFAEIAVSADTIRKMVAGLLYEYFLRTGTTPQPRGL